MEQTKRYSYFDVLRILAIFLVIHTHTGKYGNLVYAYSSNPTERVIGYFFAILSSELPVSIFFMISGGLLLGKQESLRTLFKKRILKIIVVLFVFSILMYIYKCFTENYNFSVSEYFTIFVSGQVIPSYWYLYAYLAYLLCLPLLRILAEKMESKHYIYLFVLDLLLGTIPNILNLWFADFSLNQFLAIPFTETILFFPLMGYGLSKAINEGALKRSYQNLLIFLGLTSYVLTYIFTRIYDLPREEFTSFDKGIFQSSCINCLILAVFAMVASHYTKKAPSKERASYLAKLSSTVFGIYLIETPIRESLRPLAIQMDAHLPQVVVTILWCLTVMVLAGILVYTTKSILHFFLGQILTNSFHSTNENGC